MMTCKYWYLLYNTKLSAKFNKNNERGLFMKKTINTSKTTSCLFLGHWETPTLTETQLTNMVKTLVKNQGVTLFYSGGSSTFEKSVEEAILKVKPIYPNIKMAFINRYSENTLNSQKYIEDRYDMIFCTQKDSI